MARIYSCSLSVEYGKEGRHINNLINGFASKYSTLYGLATSETRAKPLKRIGFHAGNKVRMLSFAIVGEDLQPLREDFEHLVALLGDSRHPSKCTCNTPDSPSMTYETGAYGKLKVVLAIQPHIVDRDIEKLIAGEATMG